ncbi:MAG TPA: hypothetical protein VKU19_37340 [Bryobacteraceae bacterium]|nr:hypothetical protein [Bryobacteraceae bacterium]
MTLRLIPAMLLWCLSPAAAQDAFLARWQSLHASQPATVNFQLSAPKSEFYSGDLIPLQLTFTSTEPKAFMADTRLQDRVGRMNYVEEFLVDPVDLTEDPLRGLPGEDGGMGGLSGGPVLLSEKPFSFERTLNEWVRFRKPGRYRIAILSHRVTHTTDPTRSESFLRTHDRGDPVPLVSEILTLNIVPAPSTWVKEQIAEARAVLNAPPDPNAGPLERRQRAGRTLRFLESPDAAIELVRHLDSGNDAGSWALYMGVLGSPYRRQLLPLMEARLAAPDQPVWDRYLDTLSQLAGLLSADGPMAPFPKDVSKQEAWRNESRRRAELERQKRQEYIARLVDALPAKQPEARAVSMNTLLDAARGGGTETPWLPALTSSLVADFHKLPSRMQSDLLTSRWSLLKSQTMLPALRAIYAHPPEPRVDPPLEDTAVRRIYELAPDEGRRIILAEIAHPQANLSMNTLSMLKEGRLPELNDALASRLESRQYVDALIVRYATGDIVERVEKAQAKRDGDLDQQKLPHCGGPLVYYYLQFDPAYGEKMLRADFGKPAGAPACYDMGFQFRTLDRNAYSPALERLAVEFLSSPKVPVKRGAAEVLGQFGSPAVQKPLWETLEYFRSWWKGRESQLEDVEGQEGIQFERALRIALAQADGWVLPEDGLNRLLTLCTSNWCKQEVTGWLSQSKSPVEVRLMPMGDQFYATVGQYETRSLEQLRRKVSQFPGGTVFHLSWPLNLEEQSRAEVEKVVRSAGYSVTLQ